MWHLTVCKISVSLSFLKWNDFYRISELMLGTLIPRYSKTIILFLIQFKKERLTEILKAVRYHILWSYNTIYQFIKSFLNRKMSIFKEYGTFKPHFYIVKLGFTNTLFFLITA